jgi:hypothetical protein
VIQSKRPLWLVAVLLPHSILLLNTCVFLAGQSEEAKILAARGVIGQIDNTMDLQDFLKQVGTEKVSPSKLDDMIRKVMRMHEASDAATRVAYL